MISHSGDRTTDRVPTRSTDPSPSPRPRGPGLILATLLVLVSAGCETEPAPADDPASSSTDGAAVATPDDDPTSDPIAPIAAPGLDDTTPLAAITPHTVLPLLEVLTADGARPASNARRSRETIDLIARRLEGWGYTVEEEPFRGEVFAPSRSTDGPSWRKVERTLVNVIATRRGSKFPERVIEVGAHYDTMHDTDGADDNTSGVVGALEVARVLADVPLGRTVRFCFFAAEEDGLLGSRHHVARIIEREDEVLDGFINLEMIGYTATGPGSQRKPPIIDTLVDVPDEGTFIAVVGSAVTAGFGDRVLEGFARARPHDGEPLPVLGLPRIGGWIPDASRSDHAPYWTARLPAVMVTDTADFRNPHYHTSRDQLPTLDLDFLAKVATAVAEATRLCANAPVEPPKVIVPPREAPPRPEPGTVPIVPVPPPSDDPESDHPAPVSNDGH